EMGDASPAKKEGSGGGSTLYSGRPRLPRGPGGQTQSPADLDAVRASLATPNFLLKIIPHVDGTARICELVEYYLEDVTLKGAWTDSAQAGHGGRIVTCGSRTKLPS